MKIKKLLPLLVTPLLLVGCANKEKANVGLLYCSAEANSKYQVDEMKKALEAKGLSTKLISFTDSTDLSTILEGSINTVDSLFIPTDNTCANNAESINNIVRKNKKPVFAGEEGLCAGCGAITLSINYYSLGAKTGEMAADVLLGKKDITTMAIAGDDNPIKKYNKDFCEEVGITVPSDYVAIGDNASKPTLNIQNQNTANTKFKIGIAQFVTVDALDDATAGFKDAVKLALGEGNVTFVEQNAAAQFDLCTTIASSFVSQGVDLIMANATPCLQAAANATTTIPILGTSVTDYGAALDIEDFSGIVGRNISGTTDLAPLAEQANMMSTVFASFYK